MHKGKIHRASKKRSGSNFIVQYFSVSSLINITKKYKTEVEAETLLNSEGYKRQMTRREYNDFLKNESLKRIRKWLMERKGLLNFKGIALQMGIGEEKFNAWLDNTMKELTVQCSLPSFRTALI